VGIPYAFFKACGRSHRDAFVNAQAIQKQTIARDRFHVPSPADQRYANARARQHPSEIATHGARADYRDRRPMVGLHERSSYRAGRRSYCLVQFASWTL
jgi:hypothetical protein